MYKTSQLLRLFVSGLLVAVMLLNVLPSFAQAPAGTTETPITENSPTPSTVTPEASTPTPAPTPTLVPWPNQMVALQYELQETGYQINATPTNKMALILAAEHLINDSCLDISPNRNFEKASPTNRCSLLVEQILSLDPKNPAAICAKVGTNSPACAAAYNQMTATAVRSDSIALKGKDIDGFIASQYSDSSQEAMTKLGGMTSQYYKAQTNELKKQIITGYAAALDKECRTIAYEIDFEQPVDAITPTVSANNGKPFDNVLKELVAPTAAALSKRQASHRRLLSLACLDLLDRLQQVFPDSYPVICISQTYYSPQCRSAISAFKKAFSSGTQDKGFSSSEGIGKF